jgi:hypothetical protein
VAKLTSTSSSDRLSLLFNCLAILFFVLGFISQSLAQEEEPERRTRSQIIDDSTKQVYGPTTSRIFLKNDIFHNRWTSYPIDTVIRNFHWFSYIQRNHNLYQDLGNIGTATRPVYEPVPDAIGVTSGFNAYSLYWDSHDVKYYNTRSPYSNLNLILGGKGRSITNVTYSRNINPRWNFGFHFNGLFIDKQIQRQGKEIEMRSLTTTIFLQVITTRIVPTPRYLVSDEGTIGYRNMEGYG